MAEEQASPIDEVHEFIDVESSNSEDDDDITMKSLSGNFLTRNEDDFEPKIGMVFSNEDEAYHFYNAYAKKIGFTVRKNQYRKLGDGTIRKRNFVCRREGFRRPKLPSQVIKKHRLETRCGCKAKISFTIEKGVWIISEFVANHNHDFTKPSERNMLRSQRHIDTLQANVIGVMDNAGIKPSGIYSYLVEEAGGVENVGFLKSDCDNFLRDKRKNLLSAGDAQSVVNHFKYRQANDPSFFYTIQVDSENRMTNFFWRDSSSWMDYKYFGDVIIFDTTFRTNKYNLICAPFIGVNHHRQNILFGCAFLLDETTDSFVWLFESFLESMRGHQPKTIFTDQCQAMANAIEKVFPQAQHRLCLWHIGQNAAKHLSHYLRKPNFKVLLNRCLYNCVTEEEFEEVWNQLHKLVDISQSSWLKRFYELRQKWCPAFSKNYFSAGILSTQRSESMNNTFRKVTCKTTTLTHFLLRYEKVLERRRQSELLNDFRCHQSTPPSVKRLAGMAKHAAQKYTHAIFEEFYEELFESLSVVIEDAGYDGIFHSYYLAKDCEDKKYVVKFRPSDCMVECTCKKYEAVGILCLHALRVLSYNNIFNIPAQYIFKRWTKGAKDGFGSNDKGNEVIVGTTAATIALRRSQIMQKVIQFVTKGAMMSEATKMAIDFIEHGIGYLDRMLINVKLGEVAIDKEVEVNSDFDDQEKNKLPSELIPQLVLDPRLVKLKGLTNARIKSQLEKRKRKKSTLHIKEKDCGAQSLNLPRCNCTYTSWQGSDKQVGLPILSANFNLPNISQVGSELHINSSVLEGCQSSNHALICSSIVMPQVEHQAEHYLQKFHGEQ